MKRFIWRTSSHSSQTACVEVAIAGEVVAVRDSKDREAGHFAVPAARWRSFLTALKQDRYPG